MPYKVEKRKKKTEEGVHLVYKVEKRKRKQKRVFTWSKHSVGWNLYYMVYYV